MSKTPIPDNTITRLGVPGREGWLAGGLPDAGSGNVRRTRVGQEAGTIGAHGAGPVGADGRAHRLLAVTECLRDLPADRRSSTA